ncbi:hypothetical protein [Dactylosporangium sp. CA-092794]|uniref:hypothetical protein n=1 Tax=Dactylosporangium sp. CA-092794 TaxID=3239929 RepID=UPI003D8DCCFA
MKTAVALLTRHPHTTEPVAPLERRGTAVLLTRDPRATAETARAPKRVTPLELRGAAVLFTRNPRATAECVAPLDGRGMA